MVLDQLRRLVRPRAPTPEPVEPPTARERARLEHRERAIQRAVKRLQKGLGDGCSTCVREAPSAGQLAATKRLRALEEELASVRRRLGR